MGIELKPEPTPEPPRPRREEISPTRPSRGASPATALLASLSDDISGGDSFQIERQASRGGLGIWVFGWLLLFASACDSSDAGRSSALVFAAASTTDIVEELAGGFEPGTLRTSFGPTSGLARQVLDGAPVDVFLSANRHWIDVLAERELLREPARVVARNTLVCLGAPGLEESRAPRSLDQLLSTLEPGDRIAIADAGVPAGTYARQSLSSLNAIAAFEPHLVALSDVRTVLLAIETEQVVAGFVYATDAELVGRAPLFAFAPETHDPIELWVALPKSGLSEATARAFVDRLFAPEGRDMLRRAGFDLSED